MTRIQKIKQQRNRRIIFYCVAFILFFALGWKIGRIGMPVRAEKSQAFILNEGKSGQTLKSLGIYTITAYCPCRRCCGKSDGVTASGVMATPNHTIAAPKNFKFGTRLVINGIEYVVEDRGGSVKGKRLDIYFSSHSEALKWGKRKVEVFMYE